MAFLLERRRRRRYLGNGLVPRWAFYLVHARARCAIPELEFPFWGENRGQPSEKLRKSFLPFFFFLFQDWFWPSSGTQQQRSRELRATVSKGKTRIRHGNFLFGCEIIRWTGKFLSWQDGNDDAWVTSSCSCWNKILTLCTSIYI